MFRWFGVTSDFAQIRHFDSLAVLNEFWVWKCTLASTMQADVNILRNRQEH